MKTLIILIAFAIVAAAHQDQEKKATHPVIEQFWTNVLEPHVDECIEESGVDPDLIHRMIRYKEFPDDRNLACFIKCYAVPERLNLVSHTGEYLTENVNKLIGAVSVDLDYEHCKELQTDDLCETSMAYAKCGYDVVSKWQSLRIEKFL